MPIPERLQQLIETGKQREFATVDFLAGWENYETWEEATVGESRVSEHVFEIVEEDIVAYNRSCGETHPLLVNPDYARQHSPTGEVLQHPIFITALGFYCIGAEGLGSWIRSPGARNPGQRIEIMEPFRTGEKITATITTADKFIQRGKHYLQMLMEFHNEAGTLKATWLASLILPPTRADLERFAKI